MSHILNFIKIVKSQKEKNFIPIFRLILIHFELPLIFELNFFKISNQKYITLTFLTSFDPHYIKPHQTPLKSQIKNISLLLSSPLSSQTTPNSRSTRENLESKIFHSYFRAIPRQTLVKLVKTSNQKYFTPIKRRCIQTSSH